MAITQPTITQTTVAGMHSENYLSIHDVIDKPQVIVDEIFSKYGKKWKTMVQLFRMMKGSTGTYAGESLTSYEESKLPRTITTNGASGGGATAGAAVTIVLSEDDIDSSGNAYPRVGDNIAYQDTSGVIHQLRISAKTATSSSGSAGSYSTFQLTCNPYDSTLQVGAGGIADGTTLSVLGNSFGHGTGQPDGLVRGYTQNTFYTGISKETKKFDGAEFASEKWVRSENNLYSKAYLDLEFALDMREDMNYIVGENNTNSLTETSEEDSASRSVRSTRGLWKHMDDKAGKLNYGNVDSFDMFLFDDVDDYLRAQYVDTDVLGFYMGAGLHKRLEKGGLEFIREYSSTDLTSISGAAYGGDDDLALKVGFDVYKKAGLTFVCHVIDTFSAPDYLGNSSYNFNNAGFIAPYGTRVKDVEKGLDLPNIGIWYRAMNGMNRKRVIGMENGPTGFSGVPITNQYDVLKMYALSESMLVANEIEKMIQVNPR